ncbi:MAG: hypothetical protein ACHWZW_02505 [Spirulina sp.]
MSKPLTLSISFDLLLQMIAQLDPDDRQRLRALLDDVNPPVDLPSLPSPPVPNSTAFHRAIEAASLVKSVPTSMGGTPQNSFQPISVQGEAVSKTILDDRR